MRPTLVAFLCTALPFAAVHITLINSMANELIPVCYPYFEGCVTISRAARSGNSLHIFRAIMLPTSTLLVIYWLLAYAWLAGIQPDSGRGSKIMVVLGVVGSLFLILYATYLGTEGDFYQWMRRYGVTFYFSLTALAQIFFTRRLYQLASAPQLRAMRGLLNVKLLLCVLQWLIGLVSIPLDLLITTESARDVMQNIVEWNFAFAMHAYFFMTFLLFRNTGYHLEYKLGKL